MRLALFALVAAACSATRATVPPCVTAPTETPSQEVSVLRYYASATSGSP